MEERLKSGMTLRRQQFRDLKNAGGEKVEVDHLPENSDNEAEVFGHAAFAPDDEIRMVIPRHEAYVPLVEESFDWISRMKPDEVEALMWYTSNGHQFAHREMTGVDKGDEGAPLYVDSYSEKMAKKNVAALKRAFKKAPRTQERVVYRGLKASQFMEERYDDDALIFKPGSRDISISDGYAAELKSKIAEQFPVGSEVTIPTYQSASTDPKTAMSFAREVVLEVKTKSAHSVVNASAWGASEQEVLIDANRKFRVLKVEKMSYAVSDKDVHEAIAIQLEEI